MDYKDLGKRIREERLKLGLTQEQLAEYVDISASYIGQIERGERKLTLDTLVKIANRLKVSIDYLLSSSITVDDDNLLNQVKQLFDGQRISDKQMAIDIIRTMFSHLNNI